jgi:hypothetical protein
MEGEINRLNMSLNNLLIHLMLEEKYLMNIKDIYTISELKNGKQIVYYLDKNR